MSTAKLEGSARERLLAAANELFYEEGVHTVGIDRVIERAGVAKASLYSTFGSKEELVRAYLQHRADTRQRRILERLAKLDNPRDRILGIFDVLGESAQSPTFRGCAFVNASAEGARGETKISQACSNTRGWLRGLFRELAGEYGAADPQRLASRLVLLYDGATVSAAMDRNLEVVQEARATAEWLLDAEAAAAPGIKKKRHAQSSHRAP
jgi:AcrR family transcriptional regulator